MTRIGNERGFTLLELLVASSLLVLVLSAVLRQLMPVDHVFDGQTENADMQQRLRAAVDALERDLAEAGGATVLRPDASALTMVAPAVWPQRIGRRLADPPGTFRSDAITILTAAPLPAVTTATAVPTAAADGVTRIAPGPGCSPGDPVCGIAADEQLMIADREGAFDLFTVSSVTPPSIAVQHDTGDWGKVYPAGSALVPIQSRTFYLRPASGTRPPQLVRYDGSDASDVPVVDHVVSLQFAYFGDPEPPRMRRPLSDAAGPWTTYGPRPPIADATVTPAIAGSSCLYAGNTTPLATPLLFTFGTADSALVPLTAAQLTDGPWCPDAAAPARYDADLLRIRSIQVTLRVESALDALRGPASLLFARAGTARTASRYAPDLEIHTRITPPNLVTQR